MNLITNIIDTAMQMVIAYYYFKYLFKCNRSLVVRFGVYLIVGIINVLFSLYINKTEFILPFISFICILVLSLIYEGPILNKVIVSLLLFIIMTLSETISGMLVALVFHIDVSSILTNRIYYLFGVLSSNIISFIIVKYIGYSKGIYQSKIPITAFIGLLLTPVTSVVAIYDITRYSYLSKFFSDTLTDLFAFILLIFSNLYVFYLFETQLSEEQGKIKYAFTLQQLKLQSDYYKDLTNKQMSLNNINHDLKHNLLAIEGLLRENKVEEALNDLMSLRNEVIYSTPHIYTSDSVIDTILNAKEKQAQKYGIDFQVVTSAIRHINIDAMDIAILLGNALDNAIEACSKMQKDIPQYINIGIMEVSSYISCVIQNSIDRPVKVINGDSIISTKEDHFHHGFGLSSMKAIVEKHDGNLFIESDINKFAIKILIKNL